MNRKSPEYFALKTYYGNDIANIGMKGMKICGSCNKGRFERLWFGRKSFKALKHITDNN